MLSSHGEILWESENCVDNSKYEPGGSVELIPCHGMEGNQKWVHDRKSVSIPFNFVLMGIVQTPYPGLAVVIIDINQ